MRAFKRILTGIVTVIGLSALLLLLFFAVPLETWRTGRLPVPPLPPLPIIESGPVIEPPYRRHFDSVWKR